MKRLKCVHQVAVGKALLDFNFEATKRLYIIVWDGVLVLYDGG